MAKRCSENEIIDYHKTFSSVVLFKSLLLLVEKYVPEEWHVHRTDFLTVFLNGDIYVNLFVS